MHLGQGRVTDIEREVELGGPLHSKGVMILWGYLAGRFAQDVPLSLAATLVFEQSYETIEGDSASAAELFAATLGADPMPRCVEAGRHRLRQSVGRGAGESAASTRRSRASSMSARRVAFPAPRA